MKAIDNVSLIITATNEEKTLQLCFSSVARFPMTNCEVICIDSGSTDGTVEVMASYSSTIDNLSVYTLSGHLNAAKARNVDIEHAAKDYLFFLNGYTELDASFLDSAIPILQDELADVVYGMLRETRIPCLF